MADMIKSGKREFLQIIINLNKNYHEKTFTFYRINNLRIRIECTECGRCNHN